MAYVSASYSTRVQESSTRRPTDSARFEETVDPLKLVFLDRMSRLIQEDRLRRSNLSAGKRIPYRHHRFVSLSLSYSSPCALDRQHCRADNFMLHAQHFFIISRSARDCFPVESTRFSRYTRFAIELSLREVKRRIKSEAGVAHRIY